MDDKLPLIDKPMPLSYVRDVVDMTTFYPFTHVRMNDDGGMVLKRWFDTPLLRFEVSFEVYSYTLLVFACPGGLADQDIDEHKIIVRNLGEVRPNMIARTLPTQEELVKAAMSLPQYSEVKR